MNRFEHLWMVGRRWIRNQVSQDSGLAEFKTRYYHTFVTEIPKDLLEQIIQFEGCIHCGLCDGYRAQMIDLHREGLPKLGELIGGGSRSLERIRFFYEEIKLFLDLEGDPGDICPNGYPVKELIQFMVTYIEQLEEKFLESGADESDGK